MTAAPSDTLARPATETWRDIPGLPDYQASSHGRIRSMRRYPSGQVLKLSPANYITGSALTFTPPKPGGGRGGMAVARAVALAFHGAPPSKTATARHRSDDVLDNTPDNIYWEH